MIGLLTNDKYNFKKLQFKELPLQLDPFKHCIRLFVDMKFDGLENNIVEISGNGCLDWYLHIAVEERAMKYPFFSYY